jgi:uncharacterized protein YbjT (DUF2867 family)
MPSSVFLTGGTGYLGRRLIRRCLQQGWAVTALVRAGSEHKVPAGAAVVVADPFRAESFSAAIPPGACFVQLLGVPRPSPRKRPAFYRIDLPSVQASADAAEAAGVAHFVYVSVAQEPTRIMADYQAVRARGEAYLREKPFPSSFLRPWYILGPGHWWPVVLWPLYTVAELFPATRGKARALGLITLEQMLRALIWAIEHPPAGELAVYDVPALRSATPHAVPLEKFPA